MAIVYNEESSTFNHQDINDTGKLFTIYPTICRNIGAKLKSLEFYEWMFVRLRKIHTSVITPRDFVSALHEISHSILKNNLSLPVPFSSVSKYLYLKHLEAYQI